MNIPQARKSLEKLGFKFPKEAKCMDGTLRWGRAEPESTVDRSKFPKGELFRDVFFSRGSKAGFYVTSNLNAYKGTRRITMLNIFGGGKTLSSAIRDFTEKFNKKEYNISR